SLQECMDQGGQILSIRPISYTVRIRMPNGDEKDISNVNFPTDSKYVAQGPSMEEPTLEISEEDLPEEYFDQFKTDESIEKPPPSIREHSFEDVMKTGGRIEDCIKFQSNSVFVLMPG
ncbi:2261_t:CDS:2, partial [Racocetra persica]